MRATVFLAVVFGSFWALCTTFWFVSILIWAILTLVWAGFFYLFSTTREWPMIVPMLMSVITMFLMFVWVIVTGPERLKPRFGLKAKPHSPSKS